MTWPQQQTLVTDTVVMEQYLWSIFCLVSSMIGLGYGAFPPRTWPEALVWCVAMVVLASMFAVINGFIVATILSSARGRHRYKERMDNVMVGLPLPPPVTPVYVPIKGDWASAPLCCMCLIAYKDSRALKVHWFTSFI